MHLLRCVQLEALEPPAVTVAVSAVPTSVEPEAEPAGAPSAGPSTDASAAGGALPVSGCWLPTESLQPCGARRVQIANDSHDVSPVTPMQSASVEADEGNLLGNLNLHVRLQPYELIRWHDLQLVQLISTGSFGEVFLARYGGKEVSVKRCLLGLGGTMTKEQLHNLEREINTYRTLDHPQIVKYIGCVLEHPNLAIVTEYVPNGNVFDLLYTHRCSLPAAIRLKISKEVALALCYMHSCDPIVIHRDLKTQNLVLDADYSIKVCDFGKTQALLENSALQMDHDNGGSPRYMAPECFNTGGFVTEKVDIWSFGCCLVEIMGGPLPYEDVPQMAEVVNLMLRHRKKPLVPPWFTPGIRPTLSGSSNSTRSTE